MTPPHPSPPYPLEGVVSWNMTAACNYRCPYCTQRHGPRGDHAAHPGRFVAAFAALPGDWEVKLSGGEPTVAPAFLEVVGGLAAAGRRVGVVTNLSAPAPLWERFAALTAGRPGPISASFHPAQVGLEPFLEKVRWLATLHRGRVHVTCVATRDLLPRLSALRDRVAAVGVPFRVQPEKQDREVVAYTPEERARLLALGGHNGTGEVAPDLAGQPCWAGARYAVVDRHGEVFPCYPARRRRAEGLGNLLRGTFRVRLDPRPCPYPYCNCTVPQQRGMVAPRRPCSQEG